MRHSLPVGRSVRSRSRATLDRGRARRPTVAVELFGPRTARTRDRRSRGRLLFTADEVPQWKPDDHVTIEKARSAQRPPRPHPDLYRRVLRDGHLRSDRPQPDQPSREREGSRGEAVTAARMVGDALLLDEPRMDGRDDARHSPASPLGARIRNRAPVHTAASETGPLQKAEPGWSTRRSLGGRLTDTCRGYVSRDEAEKKRETVGVDSAPGGRLASHRGGAGLGRAAAASIPACSSAHGAAVVPAEIQ